MTSVTITKLCNILLLASLKLKKNDIKFYSVKNNSIYSENRQTMKDARSNAKRVNDQSGYYHMSTMNLHR